MSRDYTTVTETWGLPASPEQLTMQHFRYRLAGELGAGRAVLEIGCGSGMGLPYIGRRASHVVGGDYTMGLLHEAREHLPSTDLVRLDAQHLPFLDASLDVVLMLEMIYYLADQEAAIAECRRVLRPGGKLLICVPNPERPDFNPSPFSTRYPNAKALSQMLRGHGFDAAVAGAFVVEASSDRDRLLARVRHLAVRYRLIPSSMRMKAMVKRVLYGRLPKLGEVRDATPDSERLVPIDLDGSPVRVFKNLYAIGTVR